LELLVIFEFECMPGSNSYSAAFFRSDSLGLPPFHASSTLAKAWNCYAIAKADLGFFNSPMTGCVAMATRDLERHAARAESAQHLMKRAVMLATRFLPNWQWACSEVELRF
jgi:hypothetical protein